MSKPSNAIAVLGGTPVADQLVNRVSSGIVSWAFLGLPGLFVHNWVKGHEIEFDGTHPIQAFVSDTVHVVSTTKPIADAGFAH